MLNRKWDIRGFTLIEVIIAISIFTTITGIGYTTLNKMNSSTKEQQNISTEQLNANLINKYLVKDLENATKFEKESDTKFKLNEGDNLIVYEVSFVNQNGKQNYNLTRTKGSSSIELITNQPKLTEQPFFIEPIDVNKNIYKVSLDSSSDSNKNYQFDVTPRLLAFNGGVESEVVFNPNDFFENHNQVTFWAKEYENNSVNIGFLTKNFKGEDKTNQDYVTSLTGPYEINALIRPDDHGKGNGETIDIGTNLNTETGDPVKLDGIQTPKIDTNKIIFDVSKGVKLNIKISISGNGSKYYEVFNTDQSGVIDEMIEVKLESEYVEKVKYINIEGSFEKLAGSDGEVYIIYGKAK